MITAVKHVYTWLEKTFFNTLTRKVGRQLPVSRLDFFCISVYYQRIP